MRKKMEGDETARRRKGREARKAGERPSEVAATTGASKQRSHRRRKDEHVEKLSSITQGKQRAAGSTKAEPSPGTPRGKVRRRASASSRPSARRHRG